jgi:EAL domain-containing protein (putative c-di-GMP-specific phosphodiesterase class I)/GGDEF domain-containing protein
MDIRISASDLTSPRDIQTESARLLYGIIEQRRIATLFQPIVNLHGRVVMGFEGLIRGPADTSLHSPTKLLRLAHELGLGPLVESLCAEVLVENFLVQDLPGKLFVNFSPDVLMLQNLQASHSFHPHWYEGLNRGRIVIELTGHSVNAAYGMTMLLETVARYRAQGFEIAIDDLGEGTSNLRLWSELRPDYIKIDRYFVQKVDTDPVKAQFVRFIHEIAKNADSKIIAEGIETQGELMTLEQMGIAIGQGYFIGHPVTQPSAVLSAEVMATLRDRVPKSEFPVRHEGVKATDIEKHLLKRMTPIPPHMSNEEVFRLFDQDDSLIVLPVVEEGSGKPVGLINRYTLVGNLARPFYHELFGRQPCTTMMDDHPLMVERTQPIQDLGKMLAAAKMHQILSGFLITDQGCYLGVGSIRELVGAITEMQIEAARQANPLTQLPGNGPIKERIERAIGQGDAFTLCYFDLDHFKPFNDVYGFGSGDDIIRLTGRILGEVCEPEADFLGHIGGDDFIALFHSADWESRCRMALTSFGEAVATFFSPDDRERGGYLTENRKGEMEYHPLTTMSIGAVNVTPGMFASRLELTRVATEAKKKAKSIPGNSIYVNHRDYGAIRLERATLAEAGCAAAGVGNDYEEVLYGQPS